MAFILTFMILSLNSTPCCFMDGCEDENASEQQDHGEEDPCNDCLAFLSCGTYSALPVQPEIAELPSQMIGDRTENIEKQDFQYTEFISRIWQPPQMI